MAAISWPATLPQYVLQDGFEFGGRDDSIRTPSDIGSPKVRPRSTATIYEFPASFELTAAQFTILETFFDTTTSRGTAVFNFTHPITDAAIEVSSTSRPKYRSAGGSRFTAAFGLRIVP